MDRSLEDRLNDHAAYLLSDALQNFYYTQDRLPPVRRERERKEILEFAEKHNLTLPSWI